MQFFLGLGVGAIIGAAILMIISIIIVDTKK